MQYTSASMDWLRCAWPALVKPWDTGVTKYSYCFADSGLRNELNQISTARSSTFVREFELSQIGVISFTGLLLVNHTYTDPNL